MTIPPEQGIVVPECLPPVGVDRHERIQLVLNAAVDLAAQNHEGDPAQYSQALANVSLEQTGLAVTLVDGTSLRAGDAAHEKVTLQSVAKVVLLTGLLEDIGHDEVFCHVGMEPSGDSFKSLARLDARHGPPANPLINAGAIMLCSCVPGNTLDQRIDWLQGWAGRLFEADLSINEDVRNIERSAGAHNWSIAYLLRSKDLMDRSVTDALDVYFALCSLEADICTCANFPALLARGGVDRGGTQVVSARTVRTVISIMTTCGMYDESGEYLVQTGLPAKSGVSGLIISSALRRAGIAAYSPRLGAKGGSVRGQIMLRHIATELGWHFAEPRAADGDAASADVGGR